MAVIKEIKNGSGGVIRIHDDYCKRETWKCQNMATWERKCCDHRSEKWLGSCKGINIPEQSKENRFSIFQRYRRYQKQSNAERQGYHKRNENRPE